MSALLRGMLHKVLDESTATPSPASGGAVSPAVVDGAASAAASADNAAGDTTAVDWAKEADSMESDDVSEGPDKTEPAVTAPAQAAPAVATTTVTAAPATEVTTKPVAEPAAVQPVVTATPAVSEPAKPAAVVETPEQKQVREQAAATAAKEVHDNLVKFYALPDEMAAQLATEPENVLPVLAARMHQTIMASVGQMMMQVLPRQIEQVQAISRADTESKDAFYKAWPDLKAYEPQVLQAGRMFRQLNPNATAEQAIQGIGKIVVESLGIKTAGAPAASAPAVTQTPVFTPAGGGGGARSVAVQENNLFTGLAQEFLDEDK